MPRPGLFRDRRSCMTVPEEVSLLAQSIAPRRVPVRETPSGYPDVADGTRLIQTALEIPHGDGGYVPQDSHGGCIDGTRPPVEQTQRASPIPPLEEQRCPGVEPEMQPTLDNVQVSEPAVVGGVRHDQYFGALGDEQVVAEALPSVVLAPDRPLRMPGDCMTLLVSQQSQAAEGNVEQPCCHACETAQLLPLFLLQWCQSARRHVPRIITACHGCCREDVREIGTRCACTHTRSYRSDRNKSRTDRCWPT